VNKIILVTPLKDEIYNIDKLIKSISEQDISIYAWVIVENGSIDGSKEYLSKVDRIGNVENFYVKNFQLPDDKYELGFKYSTVVDHGFKFVKKLINKKSILQPDFIGICDADCFPSKNYFSELVKFMNEKDLGISSGVGFFEDGTPDGEAKEWVRGNCRLWTWDTFQHSGYIVGPSADTLSLAKAHLLGYKASPNHDLIYSCREMGQRTRYEYYGYSSYYRGITPLYAVIKFVNYIRIKQVHQGMGFIKGYFSSLLSRKDKIGDLQIRNYFRKRLYYKFKSLFL
jgi:glycosyltransferase involved in cell wall biosynthesis